MSTKKRTERIQSIPPSTIPLLSTAIDDMQDAFGITGLVGYDSEVDRTIGTCKAARYSYSQVLNVSRRDSYTYRKKRKHRIMYAAWTGNKEWFRLLFNTGNQNGIMDVTTSHRRNLYHILSSVPDAEIHHNKKIPARLEIFKVLVDHNNDGLNDSDEEGNTPFLLACKYGLLDIVKEYLVHHTDKFNMHQANTVDTNNPFHLASEGNYVDICHYLCANTNIDMNAVNKYNRTPLEIATDCGYASIVAKLLKYYPQRCRIRKETSEHFSLAAKQNHIDVVYLLAPIPAIDLNYQDNDEESTPLIVAVREQFTEVAEELLSYPDRIRINRRDSFSTALLAAVGCLNIEMVKLLCQFDTLNIHAIADDGCTAYELARRRKGICPEIFQELEKFEKRTLALPFCTYMTTGDILRRIYCYDHLLRERDYESIVEIFMENEGLYEKRNPVHNLLYSQFKKGEITADELFEDLDINYHGLHRRLVSTTNSI